MTKPDLAALAARVEAGQMVHCRHPHVPSALAVGEFDLPNGCICFDEKRQFLCEQHADKLRRNGYPVVLLRAVNGFALAAQQQDRTTDGAQE